MDSDTPPEQWTDRASWFWHTAEALSHPGASYLISDHATLITFDLASAYCGGAWVSVIVMSHAAIDATIRDTETLDYKSNSKQLFDGDPDLEWLRTLRNRLVHVTKDPQPDLMNFDQFHASLEPDAKRAIELVFRTIYASPGT